MAIGLIWGGECGNSVPLATQGHWSGAASHLVTARYMLYSNPFDDGAHRASMLNEQRSVGHHSIQEVCTLHNSSIMMAVREVTSTYYSEPYLIVSGVAHALHHQHR